MKILLEYEDKITWASNESKIKYYKWFHDGFYIANNVSYYIEFIEEEGYYKDGLQCLKELEEYLHRYKNICVIINDGVALFKNIIVNEDKTIYFQDVANVYYLEKED